MASATSNNPASSSMSPRRISGNHGSPTASVAQSPRRPSRQVSSPWTQIVRGESEPIAAAAAVAGPSSPQSRAPIEPIASVSVAAPTAAVLTVEAAAGDEKSEASGGQDNAGKKPVWKRPSNGASEVGPVMGASSWPALSETTKAPSNKSSSDSLKSLGDVPSSSSASSSVPVTQVRNDYYDLIDYVVTEMLHGSIEKFELLHIDYLCRIDYNCLS